MTLLPIAVLSMALAFLSQAPDRAEAERLAQAGAHREALKQFQALAAVNPDDIEARLWIARLHGLLGEPERAIDVYRSITATEPKNVQALLGLGSALTTVGRLRDAGDALNRAESMASASPAVLEAQGRLHAVAGRTDLSVAYYQRALAIEPGNLQTRAGYDEIRAVRAHRVEATYYFERVDEARRDTHAGRVDVNARVNDKLRVFAAGQHQRKFDRDESRGGGGLEWRPRYDVRVGAGALVGGGGLVLPDSEVTADVGYARRQITWLAGFRYLHFDSSDSVVVSPGVTFPIRKNLALTLRSYHSQTDLNDSRSGDGNMGFSAHGAGRIRPRLWLRAGYVRGFEGLENVSSDRLSQRDANTLSAGFLFTVTPMTSLGATYEHQWRDDDIRMQTVFARLIQRF